MNVRPTSMIAPMTWPCTMVRTFSSTTCHKLVGGRFSILGDKRVASSLSTIQLHSPRSPNITGSTRNASVAHGFEVFQVGAKFDSDTKEIVVSL
jgi:hypothetical protein